ncbi:hypothetical protein [Novosphingobium sp. Leaf2]|uniref:hypothetical protein n=1 Tax=Novosphingobium sp. Leaf2 TaxID=1735670 RepID=UPI0006FD69D0|nr:hypothetical protein [Novosphingobium sp. Leaf2]KQM18393.1 hypothetical protein ASE49_09285 [Novosphingobium sp. Leaf2]
MAEMETLGTTLDRILPEMAESPKTEQSLRLTEKWDLTVARVSPATMTIAQARKIADAPLPALVACSDDRFDECLRLLLAALPKRNSDDLSGELLILAYSGKLGGYSAEQIAYMTDKALERCEWFPTIAECLGIIGEWKRNDAPLQLQERARSMVFDDRQIRFRKVMSDLAAGGYTQDQIDAMPDSWKVVGETRGYLWAHADGSYTARILPNGERVPYPEAVEVTPKRAEPACRKCQDLGRILDLGGNEVDCPDCHEEAQRHNHRVMHPIDGGCGA